MSKYTVHWLSQSLTDIDKIYSFISSDSKISAKKILLKIKQQAKILENTPFAGRIAVELDKKGFKDARELIVGSYRIIYKVEKQVVFILAVVDSRRNLEEWVTKRMLKHQLN